MCCVFLVTYKSVLAGQKPNKYTDRTQGTYGSRSNPPLFTLSFAEQTKKPWFPHKKERRVRGNLGSLI